MDRMHVPLLMLTLCQQHGDIRGESTREWLGHLMKGGPGGSLTSALCWQSENTAICVNQSHIPRQILNPLVPGPWISLPPSRRFCGFYEFISYPGFLPQRSLSHLLVKISDLRRAPWPVPVVTHLGHRGAGAQGPSGLPRQSEAHFRL